MRPTIPPSIALAACLLTGSACELPVDPGSDLPDAAPGARLGPDIDTGADIAAEQGADITGRFDLTAELSSQFSDETFQFPFVADADQSGELTGGEATVTLELSSPAAPEQPKASTDQPAPIDESGAFQATITGYTISPDAFQMLEQETDADVALEAQIVDSDCFRGDATVTMRDVTIQGSTIPELVLEGPFEAVRQGASCDGSSTGGDTGTGDILDAGA
jgi:hypothetical protein